MGYTTVTQYEVAFFFMSQCFFILRLKRKTIFFDLLRDIIKDVKYRKAPHISSYLKLLVYSNP